MLLPIIHPPDPIGPLKYRRHNILSHASIAELQEFPKGTPATSTTGSVSKIWVFTKTSKYLLVLNSCLSAVELSYVDIRPWNCSKQICLPVAISWFGLVSAGVYSGKYLLAKIVLTLALLGWCQGLSWAIYQEIVHNHAQYVLIRESKAQKNSLTFHTWNLGFILSIYRSYVLLELEKR